MCTDNRAKATTTWINKQLDALWYLANKCVETHGRGIRHTNPEIIHSTCLAEVCVEHGANKQSSDLPFYCVFEAPEIDFICNHDVLLKLKIKQGHFRPQGGQKQEFKAYTCAFRVPFRQHLITDTTYSCYGQTDVCKAKFIILDLNAAEFVRDKSLFKPGHGYGFEEVDKKQREIVKFLRTKYLPLLRRAGHHFIHSLPDFDCLPRSHHIDWSMITKVDLEKVHVFNFNVEIVNAFFKTRWLDHCNFVDELEDYHSHSRFGDFALAEHRGICDDFRFHAFFGPPQFHALCSKEAVFTLDIRDLFIWTQGTFDTKPSHSFSKWEIKIVTDLHFVEEGRFRLDFSNARLCKDLCICDTNEVIEASLFVKIKMTFFRYIMGRYLRILEEYGHSHVHHVDVSVVEEDIYIEGGEEIDFENDYEFSDEGCMERLCITDTCGFDIITAVTQASINHHFRCLWKASKISNGCLSWIRGDNFEAKFGALQIQLPHDSNSETVTLYITLLEGSFTLLDRFRKNIQGSKHTFKDWRIAFEVKVKVEAKKEHPSHDSNLTNGDRVASHTHQQLILDLGTAKISQKLSRLPGIFDQADYHDSRAKRVALLRHITGYYFEELKFHGHHVLYSFPVWKAGGTPRFHPFTPTSFLFKFYGPCFGKDTGIAKHTNRRVHGNRNMIVIGGTFSTRQSWSISPRSSWTWSSSQNICSGVVVISRSAFLDAWLLKELSLVNYRTTFIPCFHGIEHGKDWRFDLVTMEDQSRNCDWDHASTDSSTIAYNHTNKETWTYKHSGDSYRHYNGGYDISCETSNKLFLPRTSKNGRCEIRISGRAVLDMAFTGDHGSWSASIIAKWSYAIDIARGGHGKGLRITHRDTPVIIDDSGFDGDHRDIHPSIKDATGFFKKQFKHDRLVEHETIQKLTDAFCNTWPLFHSGSYSFGLRNPCFTEDGDFTLELDPLLDSHGNPITASGEPVMIKASAPSILSVTKPIALLATSALTVDSNGDSPIKSPAPEYPNDRKTNGTKASPTTPDKEKKVVGNGNAVDGAAPPVYAQTA